MRRFGPLVLAIAGLLLAGPAHAGAPRDPAAAAALLSRYPAGEMPMDGATMTALRVLGERGDRDDISLLRNVAEHERDEVRGMALAAIASIRERQQADLRAAFAATAPDPTAPAVATQRGGIGPSESACARYALGVLGDAPLTAPPSGRPPIKGDPADLIAEGRPRQAVSVLVQDRSDAARRLEARAWEDLGEPRAALRQFALLAAHGQADGWQALVHYGVDPERLLLGLLTTGALRVGRDAELLEVLVRRGDLLTVEVLAERSARASASDRAVATDAIARMVGATDGARALSPAAVSKGRTALREATRDRVDSIRAIALEALSP